jgi:hypothetical protein
LEVLWQAEGEASLNQALAALDTAFQAIPNPKKVIQFLNNLLQAAQQVPTLTVELRDDKFLDALLRCDRATNRAYSIQTLDLPPSCPP